MARLKIDRLAYAAGGKVRVGPIDLDLQLEGVTAVLGPNGAGKTLFLGLCHGLLIPSRGSIAWDGRTAAENRRERGFVFQNTAVMRRSVADNVAFPLANSKASRKRRREIVSRTLERVQLLERAHDPAAALSGGERQRMALGRAIVTSPKILFLDEPSANLDPTSKALLEEIVASISASGVAVLWATHDLQQARQRSTHVLFLEGGKIVESNATANFFSGPETAPARRYVNGIH